MKKFIYIVSVLIVCNFILYFPLENRIENDAIKRIEQDSAMYREEAIQTLDSIFENYEGSNFGCVLYYNMLPSYELVPSSKINEAFPNKELNKLNRLSELNSIYRISPDVVKGLEKTEIGTILNSVWLANIDRGERGIIPLNGYKTKQSVSFWQSGWAIGYVHRNSEDSYSCFLVYPSMVGFLDDKPHNSKELNECIENALDFLVNNRKSFINGYVSDDYIYDYMSLAKRERIGAKLNHFEEDSTQIQYGSINDCIANSKCRVYIGSTKAKTYVLRYCNDYDEANMNFYISEHRKVLIMILSISGLILTLILIVLLFINFKRRKKVRRKILERIKLHSNPRLFMKKYDDKKVEVANNIYHRALSVSEGDELAVFELCDMVETELDVCLLEETEIRELLRRSNPINFTKPYNAEKLEKANKIYANLQKDKLTYRQYIKLQNEIESLYKD